MKLSQEAIQRMINGGTGGAGGGGGLDPSALAGYATQSWVDGSYVAKAFWNQVFEIRGTKTTTVGTDDPTVEDYVFMPNELPATTTTTEGGVTTTVVTAITNIKAKVGLWTPSYLSALGQNSSGGGGGGATTLHDLLDVQIPATMPEGSDGQVLMYNETLGKWVNGTVGGSVSWANITNKPTTITGFGITDAKIENGTITLGSQSITPLTSSDISDMATKTWVISTALSGYAKLRSANDMIFSSDEISFVPSQYAGVVHINYRTVSGTDGAITGYNFDDGGGNVLASITNGQFSGNAASATKLATARYLWGRQFDGTADISGRLYLYKPNANDTGAVYLEYESNNSGVHLVGAGLYVDTYLSALGLNSGGGGITLNEPLNGINNAGLSAHPSSSGQTIVWNGSAWTYGTAGEGTVTSITAGTGLTGGTITTSGTIGIDSTYQTFIGHGETAYGWGNHADAGYITSSGSCAYASDAGAVSGYTIDKLDKMENLGYVGDYIYSVFLLCKMTVDEYHINGVFYTYAPSGRSRFKCADIHIHRANWSTSGNTIGTLVNRSYSGDGNGWELCTFTYNGEQWLGVVLRRVQACYYIFQGTHNGGAITRVDYYKLNTREVLNSEIYDSISFVNANNIYCNASSATKLLTARTLWGRSFDGSANIDGNISNTGHITPSATNTYNIGTDSVQYKNVWTRWVGGASGQTFSFGANNGYGVYVDTSQNVGIGVSSPAYKLDVNGTARVTDLYIGNIHITYDPDNGGLVIGGGLSTTTYLSALGVNSGGGGGGTTLTEPLSSINTAGLGTPSGSNKFLLYNGSAWTYGTYSTGASSLSQLSDVDSNLNPSNGQALVYNSTSHQWKAQTIGGGGASSLSQLSDVDSNLNPSNGQALVYNSTSHQWEAQTIGGGSGTLTSIGLVMPTGFSVSPATLTANGSFTVSFASGYSLPSTSSQSHWDTAYTFASNSKFGTAGTDYIPITLGSTTKNVLTAHQSLSDYYTKSQSDNRYLQGITSSMVTSALGFTPVPNTTTWWGRSISNGIVSGDMSSVGSITMSSDIWMNNGGAIRIKDYGGTSRNVMQYQYNGGANVFSIGYGPMTQGHKTQIEGGILEFITAGSQNAGLSAMTVDENGRVYIRQALQGLRIGDGLIVWDSGSNAFKIMKYDTTSANLYTTGGLSALGMSSGSGGSIDTLKVNTAIQCSDSGISFTYRMLTGTNPETHRDTYDPFINLFKSSEDQGGSNYYPCADFNYMVLRGRNGANLDINWWINSNGNASFKRVYLSSNVYLYTDGSNIKVNIGGNTYTLTKS